MDRPLLPDEVLKEQNTRLYERYMFMVAFIRHEGLEDKLLEYMVSNGLNYSELWGLNK